MWNRLIKEKLVYTATQFPAVLIIGARQVGKTTLAKSVFPNSNYCDLETPNNRSLFTDDPTYHLKKYGSKPLILDEAQIVPQIFLALRGIIDEDRDSNGRYIILGSAHPSLIQSVSESLAGRIGVIELDPLTLREVKQGTPIESIDNLWLKGGFPDALKGDFRLWWESYLRTLIERDLYLWGVQADPLLMRRIITMLAHHQGGLLNSSSLAGSLGINYHTINRYIGILEQAFLIRRLQPFHRNVGKRLVKSPKIYIRDTGLLHHLLNISTIDQLNCHPVLGNSWEAFLIEDLICREAIFYPHSQFYFWRTQAGSEIDLIIDRGSERFAIEIKVGSGIHPSKISKFRAAMKDVDAKSGYIVDHSDSDTPIAPKIEQLGFYQNYSWLPSE